MAFRRNQVTYSSHPNRATRAAHRQGDRQFRTYDTSCIRPKQSIIPGIIAGVLALCLVGGAAYWVTNMFGFLKPAVLLEQGQSATVEIPDGSDAGSIASILYQAGLIEDERAFSNRVNQLGVASQLKPGTYELAGGSSLDTIIKQLEAGPGMLNALTIPEGSTRWGIAQRWTRPPAAASAPTTSWPSRPTPASTLRTITSCPAPAPTAWRATCSPRPTTLPPMLRPSR